MEKNLNILIVEDNDITAKQLQKLLKSEKYNCDIASGYHSAQKQIDENKYSLILLDWNLGDGDGLELLKTLRTEEITTPVLMLSANSEINDKVSVLDSGADDYLCKPYSSVELLARIRALLRRESAQKTSLLIINNIKLDTVAREVFVDDVLIKLTTGEFDLLELLMQHPNKVITRYQLSEHINKNNYAVKHSNLIDVHIKNLRKKLNNKDFISNVRGVGYKVIK